MSAKSEIPAPPTRLHALVIESTPTCHRPPPGRPSRLNGEDTRPERQACGRAIQARPHGKVTSTQPAIPRRGPAHATPPPPVRSQSPTYRLPPRSSHDTNARTCEAAQLVVPTLLRPSAVTQTRTSISCPMPTASVPVWSGWSDR